MMKGHKDGSHKMKKLTRQEMLTSKRATKKRHGPLATGTVTTTIEVTHLPVALINLSQATAAAPPLNKKKTQNKVKSQGGTHS
jgi:hypothetical protein